MHRDNYTLYTYGAFSPEMILRICLTLVLIRQVDNRRSRQSVRETLPSWKEGNQSIMYRKLVVCGLTYSMCGYVAHVLTCVNMPLWASPRLCVCASKIICHGRVTFLTLVSEAMPGHWPTASEWWGRMAGGKVTERDGLLWKLNGPDGLSGG